MAIVASNEIYRKLSSQIESQFPGFIREEGPKFVHFIKAYYEYLEQSGKALDASRGLFDTFDIDRTLDQFIENFRKEYLLNIPATVLADKRQLVKYINGLYRSRGATDSYRFLFRILFDKEIEIYYPSDRILRASDARWVKETIIRVASPYTASPFLYDGKELTGVTSGAKAFTELVRERLISGVTVFELVLRNIVGNFIDGELLTDGTNTATIFTGLGTLTGLTVLDGGAFHNIGDTIQFTSSISPSSGTAKVESMTSQSAVTFKISNGGSGYTLGNTSVTLTGGSGINASVSVTALSNTSLVSFSTDKIKSLQNVVLNAGVKFVTGGANTTAVSAALALANISSTIISALNIKTATIGSINELTLNNPGKDYNTLPAVNVADTHISNFKFNEISSGYLVGSTGTIGNNAIITPFNASGTITSIKLDRNDSEFTSGDTITASNITVGTGTIANTNIDNNSITRTLYRSSSYSPTLTTAIGSAANAIINMTGSYVDSRSTLNSESVLQDNDYYQQYSYVICVSEAINKYRNILYKLVHPAGTKLFTEYSMEATIDLNEYNTITNLIGITSTGRELDAITVTATPVAQVTANASEDETITVAATPVAQVNANASEDETITVDAISSAAQYTLYPSTQIALAYANNIILYYQSISLSSYLGIPSGVLDGTARLAVSVVGTPAFANGILKATTGSISVTGAGSNLMITPVGSSQNYNVYQINAIFSNTSFTIRTEYLPTTANATFKYFV